MVSRHFLVSGRVQGVGFRYFTYRVARDAGVRGWVRNRNDGTVEIRAEGDEEAMSDFEKKVRSGPWAAVVEDVVVDDRDVEHFERFTIEH